MSFDLGLILGKHKAHMCIKTMFPFSFSSTPPKIHMGLNFSKRTTVYTEAPKDMAQQL